MTGGIGFSRQANQSFSDNHKLGKIRRKTSIPNSFKKGENPDLKSIEESFTEWEKSKSYAQKIKLWTWGLIVLILSIFISLMFFLS